MVIYHSVNETNTLIAGIRASDAYRAAPQQKDQKESALKRTKEQIALNSADSRQLLGEIIESGGSPEQIEAATRALVNGQFEANSKAYREYAKVASLDDLRAAGSGALSSPAPTGTAKLPRNNTVTDIAALFSEIEKSDWISEGNSNSVLYIFYDLRCPACAEVHRYLKDPIENNRVQVRYIPVGALGPESLYQASLAMAGEDNASRLHRLNTLMKPVPSDATPFKGTPENLLKQSQLKALKNFNLLVKSKRPATPTFAYMTSAGPVISVITNKQDLMQLIGTISPSS